MIHETAPAGKPLSVANESAEGKGGEVVTRGSPFGRLKGPFRMTQHRVPQEDGAQNEQNILSLVLVAVVA